MSSQPPIRWGILATGHIARKFVQSAGQVRGCNIVGAASNTPGKAAEFCREWNIDESYGRYGDLLKQAEVDAVYVANTHNFHEKTVLMALDAGKHVLCEKPMGINAFQARAMVARAREKGLFLMEGMWTRFLPAIVQAKTWIKEGQIGQVQRIEASFGVPLLDKRRLVDPALAGGALLDIGIYPISFASMVISGAQVLELRSSVVMQESGVDASSDIWIKYDNGIEAHLQCSCQERLPNTARIMGETGEILIPAEFFKADKVELKKGDRKIIRQFPDPPETTFKYEIEAVQNCLRNDLVESPVMPLDETITIADTMDALRADWGMRYPGE